MLSHIFLNLLISSLTFSNCQIHLIHIQSLIHMMLRLVKFGKQDNRLCGSLFPLCLRAPHLPLADSYRMVLRNLLSLRLHS